MQWTDYIKPIQLPPHNAPSYDYELVLTSGWGKISDDSTGTSNILKFVDLSILPVKICSKYYQKGLVTESNLCVGTASLKTTCNGDSGGPLVTDDVKAPVLIGVTSFVASYGCEMKIPAAFTRVSSFLDWIERRTNIRT